MTSKENFIAAGLSQPRITMWDPRTNIHVMEIITKKPGILNMCLIEDNYLVSLCEFDALSVWDLRTLQNIKNLFNQEVIVTYILYTIIKPLYNI